MASRTGGAGGASASWARALVRPLAVDDLGADFWVRHVRMGVATACLVLTYVLVADRPHRTAFVFFFLLVTLGSPLMFAIPVRRLSTDLRGPLVFYLWSLAITVVIACVGLLDGGADSPLTWLLVLTLTFAALAYPPPGVVLMGLLMVAAYLSVAVLSSTLSVTTGVVSAVLLIFTAMTAWASHNRWETHAQQELLASKLAEANLTRDEFVATTTHELRTPVTSILGYVELLEDSADTPDRELAAYLTPIRRNAERLRNLSDDLLVLSRWDSEKRPTDTRVVAPVATGLTDLVEVVGRVRDTMLPLVADQGVELVLDLPAGPVTVSGPEDHLEQVVLNLVSNAVKYTPAGGEVHCRVTGLADEAVIEVCDTGIGIAESDMEGLFTRFFRAASARDRAIPGVGLGLSIVDEIVTSLGGRIDVTSTLGQGTTFVVRLPTPHPAELDLADR
jgi:signal transduction histidine kinase